MNTTVFLGVLFCLILSMGGLFLVWLGLGLLYGWKDVLVAIPIMGRLREHDGLTRWIGTALTANGVLTLTFGLLVLIRPSTGLDMLSVWVGLFIFLIVVTIFGTVQQYMQ